MPGVRGPHYERDPASPGHLGHLDVNPPNPPDEINVDEIA